MDLKLKQENNQLAFTLKRRAHLWTKDFFLALTAAFLFHILALVVFHIDLKTFLNSKSASPTLVVSSEYGPEVTFSDEENLMQKLPAYLIIPREKTPDFSSYRELPKMAFPPSSELVEPEWDIAPKATVSRFYLARGHEFLKEPPSIQAQKIGKAILEFKADSSSGIIFWIHFLESTKDHKLDQQIVEALKQARLKPSFSELASDGIIEVEFQA